MNTLVVVLAAVSHKKRRQNQPQLAQGKPCTRSTRHIYFGAEKYYFIPGTYFMYDILGKHLPLLSHLSSVFLVWCIWMDDIFDQHLFFEIKYIFCYFQKCLVSFNTQNLINNEPNQQLDSFSPSTESRVFQHLTHTLNQTNLSILYIYLLSGCVQKKRIHFHPSIICTY